MEVETTQAIDPRETKLREIIERGKASLTKRALRQFNRSSPAGKT